MKITLFAIGTEAGDITIERTGEETVIRVKESPQNFYFESTVRLPDDPKPESIPLYTSPCHIAIDQSIVKAFEEYDPFAPKVFGG